LLENSRNRQAAAWRQLTAVIGADLDPRPLEDSLDAAVADVEWVEVWERLVAESPELRVASVGVRRAELALARARAEVIPNLQTQAGVLRDTSTRDTIAEVQLSIEVPIFNRNQGNIRAAQAELGRARAEVRRVELELRDRLAGAFERYANARQQAEAYRTRILPNARENLELSEEGYRRGEFEYLALLTAQRAYFQSNLAYVEALANLWRSVVEIRGLLLRDGLSAVTGTGASDAS
jgi:cobalt-zinc-cadmium efflux system outer membrane protein